MLTFMSIDGKNGVVKSFPLVHQKLFSMQLYAWMMDSYLSTVDHYWTSLTRDTLNLEFFSSYLFDFAFVSVLSLVLLT